MKDSNPIFVKCYIRKADDNNNICYFLLKRLVCIINNDNRNGCEVVLKGNVKLYLTESADSLRERIGGCVK